MLARTADPSHTLPVILVIDETSASLDYLTRAASCYAKGRLLQEFCFEHLDCYAALKNWYTRNRSRFVSAIVQAIDFSGTQQETKLLDSQDVGVPVPLGLDPKTFQGFLIYVSLRNNLDRVTPVIFFARPDQLVNAQRFSDFVVFPGHGTCAFAPGPLSEAPCADEVITRLDNLVLRPLGPDERREWRNTHAMVIGRSRKMVSLVHEIKRIGPSDATVLLLGKPGTGKELVAIALHRLSYRYADDPPERRLPHTVNIASLDHNLLEDDLFGHIRGAFTGAVADRKGVFEVAKGSTVFLDEIGDISHNIQVKLLRAIEYHRIKRLGSPTETSVDMRVIAATNRTVAEIQSRFRTDFYTRLVQSCIMVPSLKERWEDEPVEVIQDDIAEATNFFVEQMNANPRHTRKLTADEGVIRFLTALVQGYLEGANNLFEGNMRTLRNVVERAYERAQFEGTPAVHTGQMITTIGLLKYMSTKTPGSDTATIEQVVGSLNMAAIERQAISEALKKCHGNQSQAAIVLGMHRDTLRRKMAEYGL